MNQSELPGAPEPSSQKGVKVRSDENDAAGKLERPSLKKRIVRSTLLIAICLSISSLGIFTRVYSTNATFKGLMNSWFAAVQHDPRSIGDPSKIWPVEKFFPGKEKTGLTMLFLGCDHDYKDVDAHPNQILKSNGRSDSMMLVRFDFQDKTINVLSLARDTKVKIPGYGFHKLNAAHEYGGPELSVATVREDFGVSPDNYLDINFESFQEAVNTLGGVDVTIHKPLDYDDNWGNLHVHLKPGFQHLNGYQAMGYVRIRHSDNDLERQKRQHEFIEALRGKLISPAGIFSLPKLLDGIAANTKSDLSNDQLLTLAAFSRSVAKENIHLETLPVTEGNTFVYVIPHKAEALIRKMFYKKDDKIAIHFNAPESRSSNRRERAESRRRRVSSQNDSESDARVIEVDKPTQEKSEAPSKSISNPQIDDPNATQPSESSPSKITDSDSPKSEVKGKPDTPKKDSSEGSKSDNKETNKPKENGATTGGIDRSGATKI